MAVEEFKLWAGVEYTHPDIVRKQMTRWSLKWPRPSRSSPTSRAFGDALRRAQRRIAV